MNLEIVRGTPTFQKNQVVRIEKSLRTPGFNNKNVQCIFGITQLLSVFNCHPPTYLTLLEPVG